MWDESFVGLWTPVGRAQIYIYKFIPPAKEANLSKLEPFEFSIVVQRIIDFVQAHIQLFKDYNLPNHISKTFRVLLKPHTSSHRMCSIKFGVSKFDCAIPTETSMLQRNMELFQLYEIMSWTLITSSTKESTWFESTFFFTLYNDGSKVIVLDGGIIFMVCLRGGFINYTKIACASILSSRLCQFRMASRVEC